VSASITKVITTCKPRGTENSTWYLTRDSKAHYSLFEVKPLGQKPLAAVRTIIESPFPEEIGKILYLGGYDNYNQQSHNTAWIYRVGIHTALSKKESSPVTATHD
jgi:hypothetical protein